MIALAPASTGSFRSVLPVATQEVVLSGNRAALRVTTAGTYQVPRADGSTATVTVDRVREAIVPEAWTLDLEDWKPADPADPTELATVKETRVTEFAAAQSWSKVSGLEDVSGIGRYRTVVDLGVDWTEVDGAVLELGEVNDTFRVRVNGEAPPAVRPPRRDG